MPTLAEIIAEKTRRIDTIPMRLFTGVENTEKELLKEVTKLINQLELNPNGTIKLSNANIIKSEEIINSLRNVMFEGDYLKSVREFADQFDTQAQLTKDVFKKTLPNFSDKELFNSVTSAAKRRAIDQLGNNAITSQFLNPLKQTIQSGVAVEGSIPELIESLSIQIVGDKEIEGQLLNWTKQTAHDNFAIADREVTRAVSEDMGVEWWRYVGGLLESSRCFCVKRNGKVFSKDQIEFWGRTPGLWAKTGNCEHGGGRIKGTNENSIWTFLGGYRCNHSLIPIDESDIKGTIKASKEIPNFIPK